MALYLLSVHGIKGQPDPTPEEMQQIYADVDAYNADIQAKGHWVFACGLHPIETATVVSVKDGQTVTTDGPFAETKEYLGGFWVIRADDLDAALGLAERASVACRGPVEVRPVQDGSQDGSTDSSTDMTGDGA
jgi:hypothetical protein